VPNGPLIPGLREYDAPRRRRARGFWLGLVVVIAALTALVVVGGLVAGIGPLRALGTSESPLTPVAWRATEQPNVIQVSVTQPDAGLCTGDEIIVRALEHPDVVEISAARTSPRASDECAGIGIAGDATWIDLVLDQPMGSRMAIRQDDRVPLPADLPPTP
jgi:hypothetical protein